MIVNVPTNDKYVEITGIKFNVACKNNSNHNWGVYLNTDGSLPDGWNVCIKCFSNNRSVKGDVNKNGQSAI